MRDITDDDPLYGLGGPLDDTKVVVTAFPVNEGYLVVRETDDPRKDNILHEEWYLRDRERAINLLLELFQGWAP